MSLLGLEDFSPVPSESEPVLTAQDLEAAVAEAYDRGLAQGRSDAIAEIPPPQEDRSAEIANGIGRIVFTLQEARGGVMTSLKPLLKAIADTALPRLSAVTLGQRLEEAIADIAQDAAADTVIVTTPPGTRDVVLSTLTGELSGAVDVVEDPQMPAGSLSVAAGHARGHLSTTDLETRLTRAIDTLFQHPQETTSHG